MTWILAFAMLAASPAGVPEWIRELGGGHGVAALAETEEVAESSGIARSTFSQDVFWTHNDSGDTARVFAFRLTQADRANRSAPVLGEFRLTGVRNIDWEDMAAGPGHRVYILDAGRKERGRRTMRLVRFVEPQLGDAADKAPKSVPAETIRLRYPSSATQAAERNADFDVECLIVHPVSGDIWLVTKRDGSNAHVARVYRLAAADARWGSSEPHTLEFVRDLTQTVSSMVTGGCVDAAGRRVVLRTYLQAYVFELPAGKPFASIFDETPRVLSLFGEPQGEAVCFSHDGRELITTSELPGQRRGRFPIFIAPLAPASRPE